MWTKQKTYKENLLMMRWYHVLCLNHATQMHCVTEDEIIKQTYIEVTGAKKTNDFRTCINTLSQQIAK